MGAEKYSSKNIGLVFYRPSPDTAQRRSNRTYPMRGVTFAPWLRFSMALCGVSAGELLSMSATAPYTSAVLNDVPLAAAKCPPGNVVVTASPGAASVTSASPQFENRLRRSRLSLDPTAITFR